MRSGHHTLLAGVCLMTRCRPHLAFSSTERDRHLGIRPDYGNLAIAAGSACPPPCPPEARCLLSGGKMLLSSAFEPDYARRWRITEIGHVKSREPVAQVAA